MCIEKISYIVMKLNKVSSIKTYNGLQYTIFEDNYFTNSDIIQNFNTGQIHLVTKYMIEDSCGLQDPKMSWIKRGPYQTKRAALICEPPITDIEALYSRKYTVFYEEVRTFQEWLLLLKSQDYNGIHVMANKGIKINE